MEGMAAQRVMVGRMVRMGDDDSESPTVLAPLAAPYTWSVTITHQGRPVAHLGAPDAELAGKLMIQLGRSYWRPWWRRWFTRRQ